MKRMMTAFLAVVLLTGCVDAREINERDFVVMAAIDIDGEGGFVLTAGCAVLSGENGGKGSVKVKNAEGRTLSQAMELKEGSDALIPYYGQLKTVVIGEDILKSEALFKSVTDTLIKNNDINMKTIILASEGKAGDVIEATGKKENEYGLYIWDYYKNKEGKGRTFKMTINDIAMVREESYLLPKITAEGSEINIGGAFVMDGFALKGEIAEDEMRGVMLIKEDIKGDIIGINNESARVRHSKREIRFFERDKRTVCSIDIVIGVQPLTEGFDRALAEELIRAEAVSVLDKVYGGYGTDALGLAELCRRKEPQMDDRDMEFEVKVKIAAE